jgi:hypothetical protein
MLQSNPSADDFNADPRFIMPSKTSVPIPKFAHARGSLDANFGIKGTLATL